MRIRLVNEDKTVVVVGTVRKKQYNYNEYQNTDGSDLPASGLTPTQRGYIFDYVRYENGDVHIHMPYRIMDKSLAEVVGRYRSFRSTGSITQVYKNRSKTIKDTRSCIQSFILSFTDWDSFVAIAEMNEWVLRDSKLPLSEFLLAGKELTEENTKLSTQIAEIRYILDSELDKEQVSSLCEDITEVKKKLALLNEDFITFYSDVDVSLKEDRGLEERLSIEATATDMRSLVRPSVADVDELYKIALSKVVADAKEDAKPEWIKDLGFELNRLSRYFPALNHLETDKSDIVLSLSGVKIKLTPDVVMIEGDLSVLKMYTKNTRIQKKKGNSRFKSISVGDTSDQ